MEDPGPQNPKLDPAAPTPPIDTSSSATADATAPKLWNPNAAGLWSLLFSPAFGAFIHAKNWRALGQIDRAEANMLWFWGTLLFVGVSIGSVFVADSPALDNTFRLMGLGLLIGWLVTQAKHQTQYVKKTFRDTYPKRGWSLPLLIGFGCIATLLVVIFVVTVATYRLSPEEVADEVSPLILTEWRKNPAIIDPSIQNITLTPSTPESDNTFTGYVDATIDGKPLHMPLKVTYDGQYIRWELGEPEE